MADVGGFVRQELAAIQAMRDLQRSLMGSVAFALPKASLLRDRLGEPAIQAMTRAAVAHSRVVGDIMRQSALTQSRLANDVFRQSALASSRMVDDLFRESTISRERMAADIARLTAPSLAPSSVASLLESLRPGRELAQQAITMHDTWRRLMPADQLRFADFAPTALGAHLASISRLAETSRMFTERLDLGAIGRTLAVGADARRVLAEGFGGLLAAYGSFYEDVGGSEAAVLALPPPLSVRPALEFFAATDLAQATTGDDVEAEAEEELDGARAQVAAENDAALAASLADRFPDLMIMLDGARAAYAARGPDYVRHFTTSLRELFTQVLHQLAPDPDVRGFSDNPDDFPRGKPTRAVRLRYICRAIDSGPFTEFVEKDIRAMVAFAELFQAGTHEAVSSYTPPQLRALLARMEGTIRFLLEIEESD